MDPNTQLHDNIQHLPGRSDPPTNNDESSDSAEQARSPIDEVWICGEPSRFPLPESDTSDPWQTLLTPSLKKDKAQCESWTEEVQNLLIFSGLFSAVVTAFIIETYKGLQPDPNATVIQLLSRIATDLETPVANRSSANFDSASLSFFSPPPSTVRINIYLFISLVLSLATVLVGIISLQWLREHRTYRESLTSHSKYAAFNMRSEALEKWRVPQIFSVLPLLLQLALVLFFIGIVEFLQSISTAVAIPVAVFIGLTLGFLVVTTVIPTLQGFHLQHWFIKTNDNVPIPCPYKSPQSNAFRQLVTSSRRLFWGLSIIYATLAWVIVRTPLVFFQLINSKLLVRPLGLVKAVGRRAVDLLMYHLRSAKESLRFPSPNNDLSVGFQYMEPYILDIWREEPLQFDVSWLIIRDNYFQSVCQPGSFLYLYRFESTGLGGLYDDTIGVEKELESEDVNVNSDREQPLVLIYHCELQPIEFLVSPLQMDQILGMSLRNHYLATFWGYSDCLLASDLLLFEVDNDFSKAMLTKERKFIILLGIQDKLYKRNSPISKRMSKHFAEAYFKLIGLLYSQPQRVALAWKEENNLTEVIFSAERLYVLDIFGEPDQEFTTQWALTIHVYFNVWERAGTFSSVKFTQTFHTHPFICEYIWHFWKQVNHEFRRHTLRNSTLQCIKNTFETLRRLFADESRAQQYPDLDYLFYAASIHVRSCLLLLPDNAQLENIITDILPTLATYKSQMKNQRNRVLEASFSRGMGDAMNDEALPFSPLWWSLLFPQAQDLHR